MPPRRSSRSTRASVEPTPVPTTKRKRSQASAEDAAEEQENVTKAPTSKTRTRKSDSSAPISKKSSTRSKGKVSLPLEDVQETLDKEETEVESRPTKRTRPSIEPQGQDDSEEEEEEELIPVRTKGHKASRRGATVIEDSEAEVEGDSDAMSEDEKPKRKAKARTTKKKALISERRPADLDEDMGEPGASEEEEKLPAKTSAKRRTSGVPSSRRKKAEREDSDDEELAPRVRPTPSQPKSNHVAPIEEDEDEAIDLEDAVKAAKKPVPNPARLHAQPSIPEEPKGPVSRLVINKLALVNFKSYAGRQEIGPFHKSFSSIVGPNGSGKSNTIDALLFVFGYRASKMRQGKVSELIHNSAQYPDLDSCSVEVHFQDIVDLPGANAFDVVPGSSLVVERQAFKDNSSKYTINGEKSSYKEVQKLLKGRGIDLDHNRFLILQGEVESIALMKPKGKDENEEGLLEYLEDIIGTSQYKGPIEEANESVEVLQEERAEKLNRLRIVEKDRDSLKDRKKKADEYLRLQNQLTELKSRLLQYYIWRAQESAKAFEKECAKAKKDLDDERKKHADDIQHIEELEAHYAETLEGYKELKAEADSSSKDLQDREKKAISDEEKQKSAVSKLSKLKKTLKEDEAKVKEAKNVLEDSSRKEATQREKVSQLEVQLAAEEKILEEITDSLKDKMQPFQIKIDAKQKELEPWNDKINKKKRDLDLAQGDKDELERKAKEHEDNLAAASSNVQQLKDAQAEHVKLLDDLKSQKATLQAALDKAQGRLTTARGNIQEWSPKASSSKAKIDQAKAAQNENRSQGKVLDSLLGLKNAGRLEGFHGRLGSLGTIPDEYDAAVTSACPSLGHMIVEKVDQGQACIEHLRKTNSGRASFTVLEKLSSFTNEMKRIKTPEDVPRLFDLIVPKDPKFAPAFYKATTNTLVARDLEQANRIAFGATRWRVVTLAGQVIDTSGTMSGGGGRPQRGGMSSKFAAETVSPQVLQRYEHDHNEALARLQEAQSEEASARAEIDQVKSQIPGVEQEFQKRGMAIQTGKMQIQDAEKRLKALAELAKPNSKDLARITKLEQEIESFADELRALEASANKITVAIQELKDKITAIGGTRLLQQRSTIESLNTQITISNNMITTLELEIQKANHDIQKYTDKMETERETIKEQSVAVDALTAKVEEAQLYNAKLRETVEAAKAAEETSKEDLEVVKVEVDKKRVEISDYRKTEAKLQARVDKIQHDAATLEAKIGDWGKQHEELELVAVDDDDDEEDSPPSSDPPPVKTEGEAGPSERSGASLTLRVYTSDEIRKAMQDGDSEPELVADVGVLEERLSKDKPNLDVLEEYRRRDIEYRDRVNELDHVTERRDAQKKIHEDLQKKRLDEFMTGFQQISLKLKEMYQMITIGGNAELELVDSMDPFAEGIIFSVMPPKKSWRNISNLSGGEKTLSSLALVFALHVFKPTPLYFMDEIDAALDFRNVSIVANYIKDRTKNAQFIIISLRNDMFELSHRLIGIYKTSNQTKSISIDNHPLKERPVKPEIPNHS